MSLSVNFKVTFLKIRLSLAKSTFYLEKISHPDGAIQIELGIRRQVENGNDFEENIEGKIFKMEKRRGNFLSCYFAKIICFTNFKPATISEFEARVALVENHRIRIDEESESHDDEMFFCEGFDAATNLHFS